MTIGTEHEFSVNDDHFTALPVSDQIIKAICGSFESEISFGDVRLGKELQKTVIEMLPKVPADGPAVLEIQLVQGINRFYRIFPDQYHLLGLGMHPTVTLDRTSVWDHDEGEYYECYDRLFNIHQHGWLNIQALQVNLSYANEKDLLMQYNRIRTFLPYLVAITASSPMVEGKLTGVMDNRLVYYRKNQEQIPAICNGIVPERLRSVAEYNAFQETIFAELRTRDAEILCEEWLNSGGLIIRFSRQCLEIKAMDEQECIKSDMAVAAFVQALLRCPTLPVESDRDALLGLMETAIQKGTVGLRPELVALYDHAWKKATPEEKQYLPIIERRIKNGSLAELMAERYRREKQIEPILADMARCLQKNTPYGMD
ncbi:glutamate-cysteine ligase family protein [Methanoregula sp. UBA64]|jgi:gamma-glutamyl:cysteine ligase YbdK (ATP-grasp superfamily)|uniref:glutamate-cysteine ligase family protein n=1 Tax=Methanoregula sp. UBA64 TaxID=1915554 RepID=UPI0025FF7C43|nr:glutamate-cysteine ligase family protein [Methanoregula sp. UBA64]